MKHIAYTLLFAGLVSFSATPLAFAKGPAESDACIVRIFEGKGAVAKLEYQCEGMTEKAGGTSQSASKDSMTEQLAQIKLYKSWGFKVAGCYGTTTYRECTFTK